MSEQDKIPLIVLTGFLGSGKTTLLNHVLGHEAMRDSVVLVNEFGEVGIDHLVVGIAVEKLDRLVVDDFAGFGDDFGGGGGGGGGRGTPSTARAVLSRSRHAPRAGAQPQSAHLLSLPS